MSQPVQPFLESFSHGDGHDHECVGCGGAIGETTPFLDVALVPDELTGTWHPDCWDNRE